LECNEIDVLIADEAHRIRATSYNRFTPKIQRLDIPQIGELINASKVAAFFIDDNQVVRPGEIGSVQYIEEFAVKSNCKVFEYELEAQFRCNGSDAFVNWINNTWNQTDRTIWDSTKSSISECLESCRLGKAIIEKVEPGILKGHAGFAGTGQTLIPTDH
jgi:hypothetical protein